MNLNKVFLVGRLTQDPESRSTTSGQTVVTVRLATNRVWNDQSSGQKKESTEYHTIVCWGRLGEIASRYLKKGALALFEGRLQTRSWTGQDNVKKYATDIIAENLQLGPRPAGAQYGGQAGAPPITDIKAPAQKPKQDTRLEGEARPSGAAESAASVPEIPIIDENDPTTQGKEEGTEVKEDLPF